MAKKKKTPTKTQSKAKAPVKAVTAVGVSSNGTYGRDVHIRLEKVMADAVLAANRDGISTEEKNSAVIRQRMMAARDAELDKIRRGQ
jgi:hypothetical protein